MKQSNIKSYFELEVLLKNKNIDRKNNRTIGLNNPNIKSNSNLIKLWIDKNRYRVDNNYIHEKLNKINHTTKIAFVIAFILGVITSIGLLSYNGNQPVNILYFIFVIVIVPIFSILFSTYSLIYFTKDITQLIVFQRWQYLTLIFYISLFLSFMLLITTQDIAFLWSTTLNISSNEFYNIISIISYPWSLIYNNLVSLELIENSQYYRLGGELNQNIVANASLLGEWWKFLAMSIIVYGISLRAIFIIVSNKILNQKLSNLINIKASNILNEIKTPIITTISNKSEESLDIDKKEYQTKDIATQYKYTLGYAIKEDEILNINDLLNIEAINIFSVGGNNSLEEDFKITSQIDNKVLIYIHSWEPPTMDFLDLLEEINQEIDIYPIGVRNQQASIKEIDMWSRWVDEVGNSRLVVVAL